MVATGSCETLMYGMNHLGRNAVGQQDGKPENLDDLITVLWLIYLFDSLKVPILEDDFIDFPNN